MSTFSEDVFDSNPAFHEESDEGAQTKPSADLVQEEYVITPEDWRLVKKCLNHGVETLYFANDTDKLYLVALSRIMKSFDQKATLTLKEVNLINGSPKFFDNLYERCGSAKERDVIHEVTNRYKGWLRDFLDKIEAATPNASAQNEVHEEEVIENNFSSVFG